MFKFTVLGAAIVAIALSVLWNASTLAIAADIKGNIPADRLDNNTYTSRDGHFALTLPPLMNPGAKAEERLRGDVQIGVFFADDFGSVYYILRTDNSKLNYDLAKVSADYSINDVLREKEILSTTRGSVLRLAGILSGGSPIVQQIKVKQKTIQKNLDLHQAMSLFLTDNYIFEVAAGVTATHQESDTEMFTRAKQRLDVFLGGLHIKATNKPLQN